MALKHKPGQFAKQAGVMDDIAEEMMKLWRSSRPARNRTVQKMPGEVMTQLTESSAYPVRDLVSRSPKMEAMELAVRRPFDQGAYKRVPQSYDELLDAMDALDAERRTAALLGDLNKTGSTKHGYLVPSLGALYGASQAADQDLGAQLRAAGGGGLGAAVGSQLGAAGGGVLGALGGSGLGALLAALSGGRMKPEDAARLGAALGLTGGLAGGSLLGAQKGARTGVDMMLGGEKTAAPEDKKNTVVTPQGDRRAIQANELAQARQDLGRRRKTIGRLLAARDKGESFFGQKPQAPVPQGPLPQMSEMQLPDVGWPDEAVYPNWAHGASEPTAPAPAAQRSPVNKDGLAAKPGTLARSVGSEQTQTGATPIAAAASDAPTPPGAAPQRDLLGMARRAVQGAGTGLMDYLAETIPERQAGQSWGDYIDPGVQGVMSALRGFGQGIRDIPDTLRYFGRQAMGAEPSAAMRGLADEPGPRGVSPELTGLQRAIRYKLFRDPEVLKARAEQQAAAEVKRRSDVARSMMDPGSGAWIQQADKSLPAGFDVDIRRSPLSPLYQEPSYYQQALEQLAKIRRGTQHYLSPWGAPVEEKSRYYPGTNELLPEGVTVRGLDQEGVLEGRYQQLVNYINQLRGTAPPAPPPPEQAANIADLMNRQR